MCFVVIDAIAKRNIEELNLPHLEGTNPIMYTGQDLSVLDATDNLEIKADVAAIFDFTG